jgi:hypothetical protein
MGLHFLYVNRVYDSCLVCCPASMWSSYKLFRCSNPPLGLCYSLENAEYN